MDTIRLWDLFKIKKSAYFIWQTGQVRLVIRKEKEDLITVLNKTEEDLEPKIAQEKMVDQLTVQCLERGKHSIVVNQCEGVKLTPMLPDLPLVVFPDSPIELVVNTEILIFLHIPVWAKVTPLSVSHEPDLYTFPIEKLDRMWVGSPISGTMSYRLKVEIDKTEEAASLPYRIICPVLINNRSKEIFSLENFYIDGANLNLYMSKNQLWSSPVAITHFGDRNGVKHYYATKAPSQAGSSTLLYKASKRGDKVQIMEKAERFKFNQAFRFQLVPKFSI